MQKALQFISESYREKGSQELLDAVELMLLMHSNEERQVALLNQIYSARTEEEVEAIGFSEDVLEALIALTRKPRESLRTYQKRVAENDLASTVKHGMLIVEINRKESSESLTVTAEKELATLRTFKAFLEDEVRKGRGSVA